jgi:DNA invertase Pin-like site-specific DNA recombinase
MPKAELDLSGTGAAYVRVSEPSQDPERQRTQIKLWLERNGAAIKPSQWFEDIGWARDETTRPGFSRMLADVQDGRISWIVVDAHDRFGTKDKFELFGILHKLREANCRLYTIDNEELTADDFAASINTLFKGQESETERRNKSERVIKEMRDMARAGEWLGGFVPFGLDVVCFDRKTMQERWRVQITGRNGRVKITGKQREEYNGPKNFPATERIHVLQLRPTTDQQQLDLIRQIFTWYDEENTNTKAIARRLSETTTLRPYYSEQWDYKHVGTILANPVYLGYPTWNKHTAGKYSRLTDNQRQDRRPGMKQARNAAADWVKPENRLFDPIISPELFERVQNRLAAEAKKKPQQRAARSTGLWLAGLVFCGKCGKAMHGKTDTATRRRTYVCSTYGKHNSGPRSAAPCQINTVTHEWLEKLVRDYLSDSGAVLDSLSGSTNTTADKPFGDFRDAMFAAANAYSRMWVRAAAADPELEWGGDAEPIEALYRQVFSDERQKAQAQLDQLEREHSRTVETWHELPTPKAKEKAKARLTELEAEIAELEGQVRNHADDYHEAMREVDRMGENWQAARRAIDTDASARRKAEAVRRVISRIVLTFEPTGRRRPSSIMTGWEILPVNPQHRAGQPQLGTPLDPIAQSCQQTTGCRFP